MSVVRQTFPFPYFIFAQSYPETSAQIKFGSGFTFASSPSGPPQRRFKLRLEGFKWYRYPEGGVDVFTNARLNVGKLEEFYRSVEMWKPFIFLHPQHGPILVRFSKPLDIPYMIKGGMGTVDPIEVEFLEVTAAQNMTLIPDTLDDYLLLPDGTRLLLPNLNNMRLPS